MMHHLNPPVAAGQAVGDLAGIVSAAIVNDNYLKVGSDTFEDGNSPLHDTGYIVLLIIAREKNTNSLR